MAGYMYAILLTQVFIPLLYDMPLLGALEFVIAHIMVGLLVTSFLRTIFSDPGYVPVEFYIQHVHIICLPKT